MSDPSVALLAQQLHDLEGSCLIVADENWDDAPWMTIAQSGNAKRMLRSNRYEIAQGANLIEGHRQGKLKVVTKAVEEIVALLNERRSGKRGRVNLVPTPKKSK